MSTFKNLVFISIAVAFTLLNVGCDDEGGNEGNSDTTITLEKWDQINIPTDIEIFIDLFGTPESNIKIGNCPIVVRSWEDNTYSSVKISEVNGRVYTAEINFFGENGIFVDAKVIPYGHPEQDQYVNASLQCGGF